MNFPTNGIPVGMAVVPRNRWYVAASRQEIGREILARRLLDKALIFYRTEAGEAVAIDDRCPHRFMPLSMGRLLGDEVECAYHGMRFGADGRCTKVPTAKVPGRISVRTYPLIERGLWTWIWMGNPDQADPSLLPSHGYGQDDYQQRFHFCYPMNGNFIRLHENLMDSSHATFLHQGTFDDGELATGPYRVEVEGDTVRMVREIPEHVPNASTAAAFCLKPGARVQRLLVTETHPPCMNIVYNRFTYCDEPDLPAVENIHEFPVSPSGPRTCYLFASTITSYTQPPEDLAYAYYRGIFDQDAAALDAIEQKIHEGDPDAIEYSVPFDEGSVRLRRIIMQMAQSEVVQSA